MTARYLTVLNSIRWMFIGLICIAFALLLSEYEPELDDPLELWTLVFSGLLIPWTCFVFRNYRVGPSLGEDWSLWRPTWFLDLSLGWRRLLGMLLNLLSGCALLTAIIFLAEAVAGHVRPDLLDALLFATILPIPCLHLLVNVVRWVIQGFNRS